MHKDDLESKLNDVDLAMDSPYIPTLVMKLGFRGGKLQNSLPLDLLPAEKADDKIGFGTLPLLESLGSVLPKFPETEDMGEQLSALLRRLHPTNNHNPTRLRSILQSSSFPTMTTGSVTYEWPEYARLESGHEASGQGTSHSGLYLLVSSFSASRAD